MNPNRSNDAGLDALADRLRSLPAPPVPAGLEAKLLADIPAVLTPRRRQVPRLWLAGALAAAVVLLAFAAGYHFGKRDVPPERHYPTPTPEVAELPPTLGNYRLPEFDAGGHVDAHLTPLPSSFEWPVQLTVPVTARHLPANLTD